MGPTLVAEQEQCSGSVAGNVEITHLDVNMNAPIRYLQIPLYLFFSGGKCANIFFTPRFYGWPALLADSECFSAATALAVFFSNFDSTICISESLPWTRMAQRNSTLPYLL